MQAAGLVGHLVHSKSSQHGPLGSQALLPDHVAETFADQSRELQPSLPLQKLGGEMRQMTGTEDGKAWVSSVVGLRTPPPPCTSVNSGYPSSLPLLPAFKKSQTHLPASLPAKPGKEHVLSYSKHFSS